MVRAKTLTFTAFCESFMRRFVAPGAIHGNCPQWGIVRIKSLGLAPAA